MKKFWLILILLAAGCGDGFRTRDAYVDVNNTSPHAIAVKIGGNPEVRVPAGTQPRFTIKIEVAQNEINRVSGPNTIDKITYVPVLVTDSDAIPTVMLSRDSCRVGSKIIAVVTYRWTTSNRSGSLSCTSNESSELSMEDVQ